MLQQNIPIESGCFRRILDDVGDGRRTIQNQKGHHHENATSQNAGNPCQQTLRTCEPAANAVYSGRV